MYFIERYRTKLSQLLAVIFILAFAFSNNALEWTYPAVPGVMMLIGCALVGVATVGRLWCALYIAGYKTDKLITSGPYSMCRNPLYFFSLLGGIGVGLCTEYLVLAAVIVVAFAAIYPITIKARKKSGCSHIWRRVTEHIWKECRALSLIRVFFTNRGSMWSTLKFSAARYATLSVSPPRSGFSNDRTV